MNKVAIAFLCKDRVEQSRESIQSLRSDKYDLWLIDGSTSLDGTEFADSASATETHRNIRGGADAAIVYALTNMLKCGYEYVGLCEQDVKLHKDWFGPTIQLFKRGEAEGLEVGAVSARAYRDRILVQRDGFSLMHNLGAGHTLFSRKAVEILLNNYRTGFTLENRIIFMQLSGIEIARYWAFGAGSHAITADWSFNATLARHGLASLALVPQCATMLENIAPMGLRYADAPVELLRNDKAFDTFARNTQRIREGAMTLEFSDRYRDIAGSNEQTIFAHQVPSLGGWFENAWQLKWSQGFGPFAYRAKSPGAKMTVPIYGTCAFIVSGGKTMSRLKIEAPGFDWETTITADQPDGSTSKVAITGDALDREITMTALTAGLTFYGIQTRFPQRRCAYDFDWSKLPPVE